MGKGERISPIIRGLSGVIGTLGVAAIAFDALQDRGIRPDLMLFARFFAGFIFLYVAFFGTYPWVRKSR